LAIRPVLVVVAAKCVLHLVVAGRYGWQRDELYYAVAGRHLQGGYVEFPPVTAWLSALARVLFGWSLVGFRAFAILAGAATIVVAALVARDLGGGRRAQTLAAVAVGFSPILVATNGLSSRSPSTSSRPWWCCGFRCGWRLAGVVAVARVGRRRGAGDQVHARGRRGPAADGVLCVAS
jgi:Dolichyl-phosphate-mannose-protein mannosyltransferase